MLFVLVLTMARFVYADTIETTSPVSIILDRFTIESWNKQSIWDKTRISIVHHLNKLCKKDTDCNAQYGIDNVHLLNAINCGPSSVCLNVTVDKPVLNKIGNGSLYNYTLLLNDALFQAKVDIEQMHGKQYVSSSTENPGANRATRFLLVLLGISIVAIVFALTIFIFQLIRQIHYSKLVKATRTGQETQDERFSDAPSFSVLH